MLEVIALPETPRERPPSVLSDPIRVSFRRQRFEPLHDVAQGQRPSALRRGNPPWLPDVVCRGNPLWLPFFIRAGTGTCPYRLPVLIWAGTGACPYGVGGQHDNGVDVIGHHHEGIRLDAGVMVRQFVPCGLHHLASVIQTHFAANDVPEETRVILRADGHEIGPRLGVIVVDQANRPTVMFLRVILHSVFLTDLEQRLWTTVRQLFQKDLA